MSLAPFFLFSLIFLFCLFTLFSVFSLPSLLSLLSLLSLFSLSLSLSLWNLVKELEPAQSSALLLHPVGLVFPPRSSIFWYR